MTYHAQFVPDHSKNLLNGSGRLLLAVLLAVTLFPITAFAQPVSGTRGLAPRRTWTWNDAIAFDKTLPPKLPKKPGTASPNVFPPPALPGIPLREGVRPEDADPIKRGGGALDGPCPIFVGSALGVQFEALADNTTSIPPDTMGAISPSHAMTMLNTQVRIQDRGGITDYSTVSLGAFWPDLSNPFDPKVFYDRLSQRWIAVCPGSSRSAASEWSIAVSLTEDPTGGWGWLTLDSDANNTRWADYPCVGFNDKWIVVTFNMLGVDGVPMPGPTGPKMWVIDKAEMLGPGPGVTYWEFDIGFINGGTALQPAVCLDANEPDVMIVDTGSFLDTVDGFPLIRISRITGLASNPIWEPIPGSTYTTPGFFKAPHRYTDEVRTAPQSGSSTPIEVGNSRACNAVFRNGRLHFCHSGGGFFGGVPTNETLIFWYVLEPTLPAPIVNWSYFGEGTGKAVFYPSIAVNCHGDIGIGYSRTNATINVSTGFAFIPAGNAGAATYNLAAGGAGYVRLDSSGRNRWGDYSATVVDPRDDMSFWTIQESASATANRWTTRWSQFPHLCTAAPVITLQPQNASFCPGDTLTLSIGASGSGNSYQWFREGTRILGANASTLQIPNAVAGHSGIYHAIVTNNCGVTRSANVTVRVGLTIASQPADATTNPCEPVLFGVTVQFPVGTVAYRWYREFAGFNIPLEDGGRFSGVHTGLLSISGVRYEDEGRYICRVFDPACANVELFSRYASLTMNTPAWMHRTSSGPRRRLPLSSDLVYDASRGVCVLYGGAKEVSGFDYLDDTWEWDGVEWTQKFPPNNPGKRGMHELVYDSVRNKVLLFGGYVPLSAPGQNAEVWEYDGNNWIRLTTSPGGPPIPPGMQGETAFNPTTGRLVLLAQSPNGTTRTWEFDPVTLVWQDVVLAAGPNHTYSPVAYDAALGAVLATTFPNGTYQYNGSAWTTLLNISPPRDLPVLAFDPFRNRTTMFACCRNTASHGFYHNDTYAFNGSEWAMILGEFQPQIANRLWPVAMCFDSRRNAMVVIGNSFNTFVGENSIDTWEYRYFEAVAIDRQPKDQALTIGATTVFDVRAAGAGTLTYQWRKGATPLANGTTASGSIISGAQTQTLTISSTTAQDAGGYSCLVSNACGSLASDAASLGTVCYANCDGSTGFPVLTANDFQCFLNRFAAADPQANCDGSTGTPALTANDFQCFINAYAAGCN